jgi:preprotein translocase subunit SecF
VVIFDRLRENLIKFKQRPLRDVMNLSVNETLSRTFMTSGTTLLALLALLVLGGDVIRGFVFAIFWGVIVGTYSSIYVAKNVVLMIGVKRDWSKPSSGGGGGHAIRQYRCLTPWRRSSRIPAFLSSASCR